MPAGGARGLSRATVPDVTGFTPATTLFRVRVLSRSTKSPGSRWSKKLLAPVSSVAIARHVVGAELEVEDVEVLGHPLLAHRLGDRHDAALRQPAQDHLGDALAVFPADGPQHLVVEDVVLALRERSPRLDLDVVLLQELLRLDLLMEGVRLDLVDRRRDFVVQDEVHHAVGVEVAHADGVDAALRGTAPPSPATRRTRRRTAGGSGRGRGSRAEPLQRAVERRLGLVVPGVRDPELGGDEELLARHAAPLDALPTASSFPYEAAVSIRR